MATTTELTPIQNMKSVLANQSVQEQFKNAMQDNAALFTASLIDVYSGDTYLQKCKPHLVVMEALKAATLNLPINKSLGFAWIIPYAKSKKVNGKWEKEQIPQFQIGWKGLVQLAMRTGQYRYINADLVYEGEYVSRNKLTGEFDLSGEKTSDIIVGYFSYIETLNGFSKTVYWTKEEVTDHAKRFSKSFEYDSSAWQTSFDEMAKKTLLKNIISRYGIMTVEMSSSFSSANEMEERTPEAKLLDDMGDDANGEVLDVDTETGEVNTTPSQQDDQPGF
jgi:recombination protein RecT